jgi:putative SOS response-associated peptidase YedK
MHWGLIPYWAKGIPPKFSTINATIEKLTEAASWRGPWTRGQRCIMPATGFYEWQLLVDGKSKQPYYITLNDQDIFGFAALWDSSKRDDGARIYSCTIVTTPANALMTEIHNVKHRMPAIDTHMVATPVSRRVNAPKNNDAELISRVLPAA